MGYNAIMKRVDQTHSIVVPERVRLRAEQSSPQTRQWLKDLPGLLAELEQAWELSIGQPLSGESSAYVAPVTTASGNAVIKIAMPRWDSLSQFQLHHPRQHRHPHIQRIFRRSSSFEHQLHIRGIGYLADIAQHIAIDDNYVGEFANFECP